MLVEAITLHQRSMKQKIWCSGELRVVALLFEGVEFYDCYLEQCDLISRLSSSGKNLSCQYPRAKDTFSFSLASQLSSSCNWNFETSKVLLWAIRSNLWYLHKIWKKYKEKCKSMVVYHLLVEPVADDCSSVSPSEGISPLSIAWSRGPWGLSNSVENICRWHSSQKEMKNGLHLRVYEWWPLVEPGLIHHCWWNCLVIHP